MIETAAQLTEFLAAAEPFDRIAVDTEADSLHSYREKLCLIQITVPGIDVLIDPLAGFDLTPLLDFLAPREIILQGADFDLRMLRRAGTFTASRVFDTVIAARLTGRRKFSLAALVEEFEEVILDKASRKADWAKRPLPPQMIEYAMNDTRYLHSIANILEGELDELGRLDWFAESCARGVVMAEVDRTKSADVVWRIKGSSALAGRQLTVLRALWHWRESEGDRRDVPTFKVMRNEDMVRSAEKLDAGESVDIHYLRGTRRERFFAAAEASLQEPEADWPQRPKRVRRRAAPDAEARFNALKKKRDTTAEDLGLEASVLSSKATLERIAAAPQLSEELLMSWQRQLLGL